MMLLMILLALLLVLAALIGREISLDGYGRRPGPPSHLG
jgi:hypothetical protein